MSTGSPTFAATSDRNCGCCPRDRGRASGEGVPALSRVDAEPVSTWLDERFSCFLSGNVGRRLKVSEGQFQNWWLCGKEVFRSERGVSSPFRTRCSRHRKKEGPYQVPHIPSSCCPKSCQIIPIQFGSCCTLQRTCFINLLSPLQMSFMISTCQGYCAMEAMVPPVKS